MFVRSLRLASGGGRRLTRMRALVRHASYVHSRDPGQLLAGSGGVNPGPPIPLPDHDPACAFLLDATTGGIGARSGVDAVRGR
jgi:hypothetical protein